MLGLRRRRLASLALLMAPLLATACVPGGGGSPPPPATVIVYGDSLMTESQAFIAAGLTQVPGWRVVVHQYPGTALCDWLPSMQGPDANIGARVVILAFGGDMLTPCTQNRGPQSSVYFYDDAAAADLWRSRGVRVLFASAPGDVQTFKDSPIAGVDKTIAARYSEFYVDSGRTLRRADGYWPIYLPCGPADSANNACLSNGMAQVRRSATNGHLCPVEPPNLSPCPVYSSGIFRWGGAIANAGKALMY